MNRIAAANVTPIRQRTQYSCMAASLTMCINAHGRDFDEDTVNKVMGAQPVQGASWENAIAAAQHFGFRVHMIVPATVDMLKKWTDQGIPVMIAWNPEGRPWSHASVVFDVKADGTVYVADPNIPDPDQTVRVVSKDEFYRKWFEKWPDYLVRRPALAIMPEITPDGRQMVASTKRAAMPRVRHDGRNYLVDKAFFNSARKTFPDTTLVGAPMRGITVITEEDDGAGDVVFSPEKDGWYRLKGRPDAVSKVLGGIRHVKMAKAPTPVQPRKKDDNKIHVDAPKPRSDVARALAQRGGAGAGVHHNRERDFEKGRARKPKHLPKWEKEAVTCPANRYLGGHSIKRP